MFKSVTADAVKPGRLVRWPRSAFRRLLFGGLYIIFLGCLIAVICFVAFPRENVWERFYPELVHSGVLDAAIRPDDGVIDVLMLGASTLERNWGTVEDQLAVGLKRELKMPVRVFNLATVSHTSRDSALKFTQVAHLPFDVVVIYDGINDCRMNNCPREMYREDYSHCTWYRGVEARLRAGSVNLPMEALDNMTARIGLGSPDVNLVQYGGDLKTPPAFRRNIERIIEAAGSRGALVVLQSFALHVPPGYTDEKLQKGELDFGKDTGGHRCPMQMWGLTQNVVSGVAAHNQVLRDLAEKYPEQTVYVDQAAKLAGCGACFVDVCHFTASGCHGFVDNLLPAVVQRLRVRQRIDDSDPGTPGSPSQSPRNGDR